MHRGEVGVLEVVGRRLERAPVVVRIQQPSPVGCALERAIFVEVVRTALDGPRARSFPRGAAILVVQQALRDVEEQRPVVALAALQRPEEDALRQILGVVTIREPPGEEVQQLSAYPRMVVCDGIAPL